MTKLHVSISNIGGIDNMECTFDEAVTIITGPNASNKTSLLQAIAFGLGRSTVPLKNDAKEGTVELELNEKRIMRTARDTGNGIQVSGDSWLDSSDDIELLEQFACLLEFSEIRQAVRNNGDFEAVLKAPMNIDALEQERTQKLNTKRELQAKLSELDGIEDKLKSRKSVLTETRERIGELEAELDSLREHQASATEENKELKDLREERASLVTKRNEYENRISDLEDAVNRITGRIETTESELDEAHEVVERHDVEQLYNEREEIERDLQDIEDRVDVLQSVLTDSREMLNSPYKGTLGQDTSILENTITCWACGNQAPESDFKETAERLKELVERDKQRREEYEPRLQEIDAEIEEAERAERRVEQLSSKLRELEQQREDRIESLETKRDQLTNVRDELTSLDDELAEQESEQQSAVSDVAADIEDVQVALHSARSESDRLEATVTDLEEQVTERDRKQELLEEVSDEITALTEHIENLEGRLRESFNEAMDELISVLGYEHIKRVWLNGNFDVVVAREVDGVTRQDSVDHLSESEREMVGLVLALAGYVAYDVAESVPVLMMDTLGAFDAERTANLIAYFAEKAPLVVAALLPDSTTAVQNTDIEHQVAQTGVLTA